MRWIIPAVIVAITALIIFQVNWLVREAEMKKEDEKRRITEALRETCIAMEEREAKAFIGNSLDSVFERRPFTPDDSMQFDIVNDSITRIVVFRDSERDYNGRYVAPFPPLSPLPPLPPLPRTNEPLRLSPLSPVPPLPPVPPADPISWKDDIDTMQTNLEEMNADMMQYEADMMQYEADMKQHEADMKQQEADVLVMERKQRMCDAVEDVMLEYVFSSGAPNKLDTAVLDSTLTAKLSENGIDYEYSRKIVPGPGDERRPLDTPSVSGKQWEFRSRLFLSDPDPLSPDIVVNIKPGNSSVFMRILPQIVFSLLITIGMLALFLMIYREALRQKKIGEIRRDFINNMTHEFKTPLATMSLAADTIMNEKVIGDREKVKYYAEQIKLENRKLNQQVEKVLELALTEKTGVIMNKEEVNLTELVLRAVKCMQLQVEAKGGTIAFENNPEEILLQADPFHLERVFVNLLDNALKYGGTPPRIGVSIEVFRSGTQIRITDNGSGIPQAEWELIFDPFYRVSTGDVHNVKGFGLGLSYAQSVIKEHNGSISVTQSNGAGTTFTIILMHELVK